MHKVRACAHELRQACRTLQASAIACVDKDLCCGWCGEVVALHRGDVSRKKNIDAEKSADDAVKSDIHAFCTRWNADC
jgi:hypothetical protein